MKSAKICCENYAFEFPNCVIFWFMRWKCLTQAALDTHFLMLFILLI